LVSLGVAGAGFTGLVTYYGTDGGEFDGRVATLYWCMLAAGGIGAVILFLIAYLGRTSQADSIQEIVDELKRIEYESELPRAR
jgi:hypothetical protein